jgi:hypothetical protein
MSVLYRNRMLLFVDLAGWSLLPLLALGVRLDGWEGAAPYLPRVVIFTVWAILGPTRQWIVRLMQAARVGDADAVRVMLMEYAPSLAEIPPAVPLPAEVAGALAPPSRNSGGASRVRSGS